MKALKKMAAVVLAAAVVLTMLAGCGKKYGTPEQEILKKINEIRAQQNTGLAPVEKDPTLSKAASALLEEFAKHPVETASGDGYKLTEDQVKQILRDVTGRDKKIGAQDFGPYGFDSIEGGDCFCLSPVHTNDRYSGSTGAGRDGYYLLCRLGNDLGDRYIGNYLYGYDGYYYNAYGDAVIRTKNLKVGMAIREIKGERFIMVVYETSKVAAP